MGLKAVGSGGNQNFGNITVTGNITGGNFNGAIVVASGNISGANVTTTGLVSATGNVTGGNITTAGIVTATGNVAGGNITTAGIVSATGNIASTGNITATASVAVGGATPTAGAGVAFPATQSASANVNTLDDYEEGTFTPGVSFGGGTTGITYTSQIGNYTKIGNRVFFQLRVQLSAKGSSSGSALITGLPFTSEATANNNSACAIFANGMAVGVTGPQAAINANATTIGLYNFAAGSITALTDAAFSGTDVIGISSHYGI